MSETAGGLLYRVYRDRLGEPTTHDEVRGYWVFVTGLVLSVLGFVLFLPSESAAGASGLSLREASLALAAVGLAMLVAGPVVRLPLRPWVNYTAYAGQALCFLAVVWFVSVFPSEWSVQTGNQPVIVLYAAGLAVTTLGGAFGPLVVGASRETGEDDDGPRGERDRLAEELATAEQSADEQAERVAELEAERDRLAAELSSLRASQAQFELYADRGGEYRWRLRHRNGNVVATSGEGYTRKHNARKGLASVRRNALGAGVLEIESRPAAEAETGAEGAGDAEEADESAETGLDPEAVLAEAPVLAESEPRASFEVYEDEGGRHRWRLVHDNGTLLARSGQGFTTERTARESVASVRDNAAAASYLAFDPASFEIYRDGAGEWRWRLVHRNGNVLAAASEGYTRRRDARRSVESVRETVEGDGFEVYEDAGGDHRWRLVAGNNEVVATGGEGYAAAGEAERAVERVREYAPEADALDVGAAAFEVYRDEAEEWRWRLRHRNGEILATSGDSYASRRNVHDAIESVKRNAGADERGDGER
jgi:uncharacterized protein YegP (UPF0339 family)